MKIPVQGNGLKASPKIHLLRPNSQGDSVRSWGFRGDDEVMRAELSRMGLCPYKRDPRKPPSTL